MAVKWLEQVCAYLEETRDFIADYLKKNAPQDKTGNTGSYLYDVAGLPGTWNVRETAGRVSGP